MADKLSASQIFTALLEGGFSREQATTMTAIAQAESARDPGAIGDVALQNNTFGPSVGLFQIRTVKAETGTGSDRDIEHLTGDVRAQVQAALNISNNGTNFRPWSTFTSGSFRKFLDTPLQAGVDLPAGGSAGATSDLGTGGTGAASLGNATAGADPFAIDSGRSPVKVVDKDSFDKDGDGLTDRFEALLGTDAGQSDTDRDGLSDAFESSVLHSDPLSKDTDEDGITDDVEKAKGSDVGRIDIPDAARAAGFGGLDTLDSDKDGLSDGFEKRRGTNPLSADTDKDGLSDGDELARGTDGGTLDSNRDGLSDGFAAQNNLNALQINALQVDDGTGLGSTGLGSSGLGSTGLGSGGLGSTGLGSTGLGSDGLGSDGIGSGGSSTAGAASADDVSADGLDDDDDY